MKPCAIKDFFLSFRGAGAAAALGILCLGGRHSLSTPAPGDRFADFPRFLLFAVALGLTSAFWPASQPPDSWRRFAGRFFLWLTLWLGAALVFTQLSPGLILTGAATLAFLAAAADGCIDWTLSQAPPVHAKLLPCTFRTASVLLVGFTFMWPFGAWDKPRDIARVKVSIPGNRADRKLAADDPRLLATESRLLRSAPILSPLDDVSSRKALSRALSGTDYTLTPNETVRIRSGRTRATPVDQTNLLEIEYRGEERSRLSTATQIAEQYQRYWQSRADSNAPVRLEITPLALRSTTAARDRLIEAYYAAALTMRFLSSLLVLAGAACAVLLARKPANLYLLLAAALLYLVAFGLATLGQALQSASYSATCIIRFWPPALNAEPANHKPRTDAVWAPLLPERRLALSHPVLTLAARTLESDASFIGRHRRLFSASPDTNRLQCSRWIAKHLEVVPVANSFMLDFRSTTQQREDAADVANAVAEAFCQLRSEAPKTQAQPAAEIMCRAIPPVTPDNPPNLLLASLSNGGGDFGWFLLGAAVGCLGFLVEKLRRQRQSQALPATPPAPFFRG